MYLYAVWMLYKSLFAIWCKLQIDTAEQIFYNRYDKLPYLYQREDYE